MKVVDLLFLYNFYFGQISNSYIKIWVLASQTRVKISQNVSLFAPVLATVSPGAHAGDCGRRRLLHASGVGDPRTPRCAPLSARDAHKPFLLIPFSFLALASRRARASRRRALRRPTLATAARFRAPQPSSPRTAPTPHCPDLD